MINILVVDDHKLFRMGIIGMLPETRGFKVVAEAANAEQSVSLARSLRPNVVLMDILMPGIGGLEAISRICRKGQHTKVIALSACTTSPYPLQALRAGATGYLTKGVTPEELHIAIRRVYLGKRYLCSEIAQQLAVRAFDPDQETPFDQLTGREMQIMLMVINCHKVSEISSGLHLSPKTINSYRYRIFEKLGVSSDVELALLAVRYGMAYPKPMNYVEAN